MIILFVGHLSSCEPYPETWNPSFFLNPRRNLELFLDVPTVCIVLLYPVSGSWRNRVTNKPNSISLKLVISCLFFHGSGKSPPFLTEITTTLLTYRFTFSSFSSGMKYDIFYNWVLLSYWIYIFDFDMGKLLLCPHLEEVSPKSLSNNVYCGFRTFCFYLFNIKQF